MVNHFEHNGCVTTKVNRTFPYRWIIRPFSFYLGWSL
jgi:hypothetical protein